MKNGFNTANDLLSWGFSSAKEKANQLSEDLRVSERVQQMKEQMQPTVDESVKFSGEVFERSKTALNQVSEKTRTEANKAFDEAKKVVDSFTKPKDT